MELFPLTDGTRINVAAIEAVQVEDVIDGWETVVRTAGGRYVDATHRTVETARQNMARLCAQLTGEFTCSNCATPINQAGSNFVHKVGLVDRDGCNNPQPSELAAEWDIASLGELA